MGTSGGGGRRVAAAAAVTVGVVASVGRPAGAAWDSGFDPFASSGTYVACSYGYTNTDVLETGHRYYFIHSGTYSYNSNPYCTGESPANYNTMAAVAKLYVGVNGWHLCDTAPHAVNAQGSYKAESSDGFIRCAVGAPHRLRSEHRMIYGGSTTTHDFDSPTIS